jgi:hypothetical protein
LNSLFIVPEEVELKNNLINKLKGKLGRFSKKIEGERSAEEVNKYGKDTDVVEEYLDAGVGKKDASHRTRGAKKKKSGSKAA